MKLEIDLAGDQQLNRELLRFSGRVEDASPAFNEIADDLLRIETKQFDTKGRHGSGGWQGLADATIERKLTSNDPTIRSHANDILVATERLRDSLTDRSHPDHIRLVQPHQLIFGTTVEYARFHQLGEGVQRRRELELRDRDRREVVRTLQAFMVGETRIQDWGHWQTSPGRT